MSTMQSVISDDAWRVWEPLIEAVRPQGKTPSRDLRRTISAIFWRHQNGSKWHSVPSDLRPWWTAAQLFLRWTKLGVWQALFERLREKALSFSLTPEQAHELPSAMALLDALQCAPRYVVCDRGYASNQFREALWDKGSHPVILSKRNEAPVARPKWTYRHRHLVENLWARLKEWRAVATRYEKTAASFMAVIQIAAAVDHIKT